MELLNLLKSIQYSRTITAEQENLLKTLIWSPDVEIEELDLLNQVVQQLLNQEIVAV
uniref:Uncharacterized protein n=1 Tax=Cyanothece sp. (strain PCC 7425 / ATCC 29141) TaxID=395961 RepID=B8HP96_CYAP4